MGLGLRAGAEWLQFCEYGLANRHLLGHVLTRGEKIQLRATKKSVVKALRERQTEIKELIVKLG